MSDYHGTDWLGHYEAAGLPFNLGSDFHVLPTRPETRRFVEEISRVASADTLFLLGDLCLSAWRGTPIDTSSEINEILRALSPRFERILFVPGNHDLRREQPTDNPWADFELPKNVQMPLGDDPLVLSVGKTRVALANIGYDFEFIDPALLGLTREQLLEFYAHHEDGKYLLRGKDSISHFATMARKARQVLTPEIDIMAVHPVPHPGLVTFHMHQEEQAMKDRGKALGLDFEYNPGEDAKEAQRRGITTDEAVDSWNVRSIMMGSDILRKSNPRSGLTLLYGHNHRSCDQVNEINGRNIRLLSHQRWFKAS